MSKNETKTEKRNSKAGMAMTEYIIIVALVAIAAIAVARNTEGSKRVIVANTSRTAATPTIRPLGPSRFTSGAEIARTKATF